MPYIKQSQRVELFPTAEKRAHNIGELTYQIYCLLLTYRANNEGGYQVYGEILGALSGAEKEYYRQWVAPYEDEKIIENGNV